MFQNCVLPLVGQEIQCPHSHAAAEAVLASHTFQRLHPPQTWCGIGNWGQGAHTEHATSPFLPVQNPLLFFSNLTLRICFLFLKGRSNTLTGFPYRITSLLCSHFRELSSHVHGIVFTKLSHGIFGTVPSSVFYRGHGCTPQRIHPTGVSECTGDVR